MNLIQMNYHNWKSWKRITIKDIDLNAQMQLVMVKDKFVLNFAPEKATSTG